jgi:hypothetical protein
MRIRLAAVLVAIAVISPGLVGTAVADGSREPTERAVRPRLTARTTAPLPVYSRRGDQEPLSVLAPTTDFGTTRVVLVTQRHARWLQVRLPIRPNGSTGWVRARDVELRPVTDLVVVDLTARTLTWTRAGVEVIRTAIAVGAPDTPTPTGRFYVTDLLDTPDGGAYGPYAVGLSAHSDQLTEFGGGDGQIGVHGTSDSSSIGAAVSHGCVRVPNDVITRLATSVPLGTPVTIR